MRVVDGVVKVFLLYLTTTTTNGDYTYSLASDSIKNYCPYFKNRGPSKQDDLKNCTWFKENSCCVNSEVEYVFRTLTPIPGASQDCIGYLNYLYCYICAPDQNTFFKRSTLYVCEEFCDQIYDSCRKAVLKGFQIQDLYANGTEFCEARLFKTKRKVEGGCYDYDPASRVALGSGSKVTHINSVIFTCVLIQIIATMIVR